MAFDRLDRVIGRPMGSPTAVQAEDYPARLGECVLCDPTGGAFEVELPRVGLADVGRVVAVKNVSASSSTITIRAALPGDTVEGQQSIPLASGRGYRVLVCVGAGEWISIHNQDAAAQALVAVGVDNATGYVCLLDFDGSEWTVRAGLPEEAGTLYGVYAASADCVWVCGTAGDAYESQGLLYRYDGSTWTSMLDDALTALSTSDGDPGTNVVFAGVSGSAADNISICGWVKTLKAYGSGDGIYYADGYNAFILDYDGESFTLGLDEGDDEPRAYAISVSPGGHKFARTWDATGWGRIFAKQGGAWASILYWNDALASFPLNSIKAFSNVSVIAAQNFGSSGYHLIYNGSNWTDSISGSAISGESVSGIDVNDVWVAKYPANTDLATHVVNGSVAAYDAGDNPWTVAIEDVVAISNSDVWVAGHYESGWSAPVLSHFDGSNWSDDGAFNVNGLGNISLWSIRRIG